MVWAKIDDHADEHPKLVALSDAAHRLWFNALMYCCRNLTDGFVPKNMLRKLTSANAPGKLTGELERQGLWESAEGGWQIHDFLTYQPSKVKVLAEREVTRKRVERFRNGQNADKLPAGSGAGNAVTNAVGNTVPVPAPVPGRGQVKPVGIGLTGTPSNPLAAQAREASGHQKQGFSEVQAPFSDSDSAPTPEEDEGGFQEQQAAPKQHREEGEGENAPHPPSPRPPAADLPEAEQPYWRDASSGKRRQQQFDFFASRFVSFELQESKMTAWRKVIGPRMDTGGSELAQMMANALPQGLPDRNFARWLWDTCGPLVAEYDRLAA